MKCIDLVKECLKILGICYSYNQKLQTEKKILLTVKRGSQWCDYHIPF